MQISDSRTLVATEGGGIDLLTAGFPCTQTSIAAQIHDRRDGLAGKDSGLWFEALRAFAEILPKNGVVENVSGARKWAPIIQKGLEDLGYTVSILELQAVDVGLPHKRARMFFIANADGKRFQVTRQFQSPEIEWIERLTTTGGSWLSGTPGITGSFNGLPNRVDRVTALGNSVAPKLVHEIFKAIGQCSNSATTK